MKILLAGASGLIGTALQKQLIQKNHEVVALKYGVNWNPENNQLDLNVVEGVDAIINLAGENIFGRWSSAKKQRILSSRIQTTSLLVESVLKTKTQPKVFINASAIGYYGNRGDEILIESSPPGHDFLSQVCQQWEEALNPLNRTEIRQIILRTGVVLSPEGGALKTMLTPFKLGLGGVLGSGDQYMSWIALEDMVSAILFLMENESCEGPFNMTAPKPVRNKKFVEVLGEVLYRPTWMPQPTFLMRLFLGEMVDALLLASTRAEPAKLLKQGYKFLYPELYDALNHFRRKL